MKNLNDQFSDEEKHHLNYLGSMMGRPNTPEEQELENILEAMEKGRRQKPGGRAESKPGALGRRSRINRGIPRVCGERLLGKTFFETGQQESTSTRTQITSRGHTLRKPVMSLGTPGLS